MDPATASATMDSRKPAVRSLQLGSKAPNPSDTNRELSKRTNGGGRRQQRDLERDGLVGGGYGGTRGRPYAGPNKTGGLGRCSNKVNRNKEKEDRQIESNGPVSLDPYDDEEYYDSSENLHRAPQYFGSNPRSYRNSLDDARRHGGGGGKKQKQRYSSCALYKTRTKERFLQARCQFLVNYKKEAEAVANASMPVGFTPPPAAAVHSQISSCGTPECTESDPGGIGGQLDRNQKSSIERVQAALDNPDTLVTWSSVEEVLLHMTQPTNCPVCLYPPVAPQVTRCGHIYCYPCILHYLALSDKKWRACPICYEMVVREDLKSVVCVVHPDYSVGNSIEMRLMCRHRDSSVAVPVQQSVPPGSLPICLFRRTMQASTRKVLAIIERERTALEVQMATEGSEPEACFIEQALALLNERQQNLPDFGVEDITEQFSNYTLSNDHNTESESESSFTCKNKQCRNTAITERDKCVRLPHDANSAGQNSSLKVLCSTNPETCSELEASKNRQDSHEESDRSRTSSGTSSLSDVLLADPAIASSLSAAFNPCEIQECLGPKEDSDDSSSVSSVSTELVFSDITGDICSLGAESTYENISDFTLTESALNNIDILTTGITDDCSANTDACAASANVTDACGASNAVTSECLQFDLEVEIGSNDTEAVLKRKFVNAPKTLHYFYQANDGSHVYLQPFNFAMLAKEFGGPESCPSTIAANIVEKEYGMLMDRTTTSGNRRFLCHLPLCCSYELVELDLRPLVSDRTLSSFSSGLHSRENERAKRAKTEEEIELRNREKEEKEYRGRLFQYVKSAYTAPGRASSDTLPNAGEGGGVEFREEDYPAMVSTSGGGGGGGGGSGSGGGRPHGHSMSSDGQSSSSLTTSPDVSSSNSTGRNGRRKQQQQPISFAKVLTTQTPSRSFQPRPSQSDAGPASTAGAAPAASVWARGSQTSGPSGSHSKTVGWGPSRSADGDDNECRFNAPDYQQTYSMSFDTLLSNALIANPAQGSGGKKNKKGKKKSKPVVVFSTGV